MAAADQRGAYGFRLGLPDLDEPLPYLVTMPPDADPVVIAWRFGTVERTAYEVGVRSFHMSTAGGGALTVDYDADSIDCVLPQVTSAASILHPLATMPLAFLAHHRGWTTLHGGAFLAGGRAWIVTGEAQAGKSTTLASLAARGLPIMADDLCVVEGAQLHAGPTCIDLRATSHAAFPAARSIGVVAGRERFRLTTPAGPGRAAVGGIVLNEWTDGTTAVFEPLDRREQLELIHAQHYAWRVGPPPPQATLDLLDVPMWRLRRPRGLESLDQTVSALLELALR